MSSSMTSSSTSSTSSKVSRLPRRLAAVTLLAALVGSLCLLPAALDLPDAGTARARASINVNG